MKLGLEQAVLGTNAFSDRAAVDAKMDSKEMEQLLRQVCLLGSCVLVKFKVMH
jgi:hypothetical protein